ncbi:MAG: divergent polysaccharide deacetylase family protein [Desulfobulbaceae bacterium]|nr:divergent polysaccharide deacetylase family protein [Desulfobulbaceae bacterium]HIJ78641.1 divergent polysaccharide deacetylase family protein [Deltaproteobacteria bacterium]
MAYFPSKKTTRKKRQKKQSGRLFGIFSLILLVSATLTAGFYIIFLGTAQNPAPPLPLLNNSAKKAPGAAKTAKPTPQLPPHTPTAKPAPTPAPAITRPRRPKVAIIIDDMGYKEKGGEELMQLNLPLSFAFLPFAPFTRPLVEQAYQKKRTILLHLPLEATDQKWDPGPGVLKTSMDAHAIKTQLRRDLDAVPHASGINNHMGSYFTANPLAMKRLLVAIRDLDVFFLDSVTSAQSTGYQLAVEMGVKTGRRNIFLDNEQTPEKVIEQLQALVKLAKKEGEAVGIGHPYPATITALKQYKDRLVAQVEVVGINQLVR